MKIGAPNIPGVTPFSWVPSTWAHQPKKPSIKGWGNINGNTIHIFVCIYDALSSYNLLCNGTYSRDMKNTICLSVYVLLLHFKHA